jgi:hypothetical protein
MIDKFTDSSPNRTSIIILRGILTSLYTSDHKDRIGWEQFATADGRRLRSIHIGPLHNVPIRLKSHFYLPPFRLFSDLTRYGSSNQSHISTFCTAKSGIRPGNP